jgi:uncharacterized LabA/DUF88 family protein
MARAAVFIDGSSLVSCLSHLNWPAFIDPIHLSKKLAKNDDLVSIIYTLIYTFSTPHPNIPLDIKRQQQRYHDLLRTIEEISLDEGWRSPPHYEEKAVDVKLAINMVYTCCNDGFDICYVVSGDSDLAPAIEMVRGMSKEVVWVYFWDKYSPKEQQRFSFRMAQASSSKIGFKKKWAKPLILN